MLQPVQRGTIKQKRASLTVPEDKKPKISTHQGFSYVIQILHLLYKESGAFKKRSLAPDTET